MTDTTNKRTIKLKKKRLYLPYNSKDVRVCFFFLLFVKNPADSKIQDFNVRTERQTS